MLGWKLSSQDPNNWCWLTAAVLEGIDISREARNVLTSIHVIHGLHLVAALYTHGSSTFFNDKYISKALT